MKLSEFVQKVSASFVDSQLSVDSNYQFSYLNRGGLRMDVYRGRVVVTDGGVARQIQTRDIVDVLLPEVEKRRPEDGRLILKLKTGEALNLVVDTVSDGYLDIFLVYTMMRRRMIQDR